MVYLLQYSNLPYLQNMKHLTTLVFVALFTCKASAQANKIAGTGECVKLIDSVAIRVYNNTRYYLRSYKIILGAQSFTFSNINKHQYSSYKRLPYLPDSYERDVKFVRKRLLQYDEWIKVLTVPVDFIEDGKLTSGRATINVRVKKRDGRWAVETDLVKP
jgi:hypothetical protein